MSLVPNKALQGVRCITWAFTGTTSTTAPCLQEGHRRPDWIGRVNTGANGVTVRVIFDAEGENTLEQQRQGWRAILDNFARHVEARQ
jgi:hypothetical protein